MDKNAAMRAADSERRHREVMTESDRRRNEAMASLRELIERTR